MNCEIEYEELAALAAGELEAERQGEIRQHLDACPSCRSRLEALTKADSTLKHLPLYQPGAAAMLAARHALAEELRGAGKAEIMTLAEVGQFLRLTGDQLGEIVDQLPAFELAGQVRVRRAKLIEWLQHRENQYARESAASWAARAAAVPFETGAA